MKKANSLYVHIPFCRHICAYCDFPKVLYRDDWASSYIGALFSEFSFRKVGKCKTLYLGGGTPTSLKEGDLASLLSFLSPYLEKGGEWTVEANPETLNREKVALLAKYGVNRVSIGMQTSSPSLLEILGRKHRFEDVRRAVALLKEAGIDNVNVDLMYGVPNESEEDLRNDLQAVLSLGLTHISAYSLILEEGTSFFAKGVKPLDDDAQQGQFDIVKKTLGENGFERYEISNFAKEGYRCKHNLAYWKDERYYGLGLGAAGYLGKTRYVNTKNLSKYLRAQYEGESETLGEASEKEDFLLTNLRLVEGFPLDGWRKRFGEDFLLSHKDKIDELRGRGLLRVEKGNLACTERGLDLLDTVLLALFA